MRSEGVVPFPGFVKLIKLLEQKGFIIALASNRKEEFVHLVLDIIGVKESFRFIVGGEGRPQKPFPDIYLHAAKELGLKPADCVVLEDSAIGVVSAKDAGMKVIAVPNIYTEDHDFSKADIIVASLSDINMDVLNNL